MNKILICFFILFFSISSFSQKNNFEKICAISDSLYLQYECRKAIDLLTSYFKTSTLNDLENAEVYYRMGNLHYDLQNFDSTETYFNMALKCLSVKDNFDIRTNIEVKKTFLPKSSIKIDENLKSIYELMKSPAFHSIKAGTKARVYWYWLSVSWLFKDEDENKANYDSIISIFNKTKISRLDGLLDKQFFLECLCSTSTFIIVNNHDSVLAMHYINKVSEIMDKKYKRSEVFYQTTLGVFYFYTNQLELSKSCYYRVNNICPNNTYDFSNANLMIGKILHQQDSITKSIEHLIIAKDAIKNIYEPYYYNLQLIKWLANSYISKDSSSTALFYLIKYVEMNKVILEGRSVRSLNAVKFIRKMDLVEQQKLQEELKHKSERKIFLFILSATAIIVIVLFVLFYLYRNFNKRLQQQKKRLELALKKNKTLVKEMHHRVKNNLQTVSGLLNLQSKKLKNEDAIKAMTDAQNRIQSVSIIHQSLYNNASDSESIINIKEYCHNLTKHIEHVYKYDSVSAIIEVPNNINFSLDTAIPLGLILNEFITNSFKHAFNDLENGKIYISLEFIADKNQYLLKYSDSGKGIPQQKDSNSFGLSLINMLTLQLGASITFPKENNNEFLLFFNATNIIFAT